MSPIISSEISMHRVYERSETISTHGAIARVSGGSAIRRFLQLPLLPDTIDAFGLVAAHSAGMQRHRRHPDARAALPNLSNSTDRAQREPGLMVAIPNGHSPFPPRPAAQAGKNLRCSLARSLLHVCSERQDCGI